MSFELEGVIERIGDVQQKSEKFSLREFAVKYTKTWTTKDGEQGSKDVLIGFQCTGRTMESLDRVKVGDNVTVKFDLEGRDYNGRVLTNVNAWYVAAKSGGNNQQPVSNMADDDSGLPF